MARRRRKSPARMLIVVAALGLAGVALWANRALLRQWLATIGHHDAVPTEPGAADGRPQRISGELKGDAPVRDGQLGVSANAAVLFRHVEMYQWQEHCEGNACRYEPAWSAPVDSRKFRDPKGHENPPAPFNDAVYFAPALRVGDVPVDPDLLVAQLHAADYAVHNASLPPNLAASFGEREGALYAGGDPAHPAVGEVRISYRIIAYGPVALNGVQRGDKLFAH